MCLRVCRWCDVSLCIACVALHTGAAAAASRGEQAAACRRCEAACPQSQQLTVATAGCDGGAQGCGEPAARHQAPAVAQGRCAARRRRRCGREPQNRPSSVCSSCLSSPVLARLRSLSHRCSSLLSCDGVALVLSPQRHRTPTEATHATRTADSEYARRYCHGRAQRRLWHRGRSARRCAAQSRARRAEGLRPRCQRCQCTRR